MCRDVPVRVSYPRATPGMVMPLAALPGVVMVSNAERHLRVMLAQHLRNRRRQRRLAMVNVNQSSDVHLRLRALKFSPRPMFFKPLIVSSQPERDDLLPNIQ